MSYAEGDAGYHVRMLELQEKLRNSEKQRIELEDKFNEMMRINREADYERLRLLRHKYHKFLEGHKKRQDRNENILRMLDQIENRAATLAAKTDRFKLFRKHYDTYLKRVGSSTRSDDRSSQEQLPVRRKLIGDSRAAPTAEVKLKALEQYLQNDYIQNMFNDSKKSKENVLRENRLANQSAGGDVLARFPTEDGRHAKPEIVVSRTPESPRGVAESDFARRLTKPNAPGHDESGVSELGRSPRHHEKVRFSGPDEMMENGKSLASPETHKSYSTSFMSETNKHLSPHGSGATEFDQSISLGGASSQNNSDIISNPRSSFKNTPEHSPSSREKSEFDQTTSDVNGTVSQNDSDCVSNPAAETDSSANLIKRDADKSSSHEESQRIVDQINYDDQNVEEIPKNFDTEQTADELDHDSQSIQELPVQDEQDEKNTPLENASQESDQIDNPESVEQNLSENPEPEQPNQSEENRSYAEDSSPYEPQYSDQYEHSEYQKQEEYDESNRGFEPTEQYEESQYEKHEEYPHEYGEQPQEYAERPQEYSEQPQEYSEQQQAYSEQPEDYQAENYPPREETSEQYQGEYQEQEQYDGNFQPQEGYEQEPEYPAESSANEVKTTEQYPEGYANENFQNSEYAEQEYQEYGEQEYDENQEYRAEKGYEAEQQAYPAQEFAEGYEDEQQYDPQYQHPFEEQYSYEQTQDMQPSEASAEQDSARDATSNGYDGAPAADVQPIVEKKLQSFGDIMDTDSESVKQDTRVSNESDFDFSNA